GRRGGARKSPRRSRRSPPPPRPRPRGPRATPNSRRLGARGRWAPGLGVAGLRVLRGLLGGLFRGVAVGGLLFLRGAATRRGAAVVAVETGAFEDDAGRAENLGQLPAAALIVGAQGVVLDGLPDVEFLAAVLAAVPVGGHQAQAPSSLGPGPVGGPGTRDR